MLLEPLFTLTSPGCQELQSLQLSSSISTLQSNSKCLFQTAQHFGQKQGQGLLINKSDTALPRSLDLNNENTKVQLHPTANRSTTLKANTGLIFSQLQHSVVVHTIGQLHRPTQADSLYIQAK